MYQKIFFVNDESDFINFKNELNKEYKKCLKVYINFIKEDNLVLREKDNQYKNLESVLENFKDIDMYSLTFIYINNQELTFRKNWKEKTAEELLNDLTSMFDKRKINRCFNYENINRSKEEIIEKIETSLFSEWNYEDRAFVRKYLKKVIMLDQKVYKDEREKILEEIKRFKTEINKELKITEVREEAEKICRKLSIKYNLIEEYDFSLLSSIFPKRLLRRRGSKIELEKTIENLEKLVLDESYKNIYEYGRATFKKYLKKFFGKGLTEEKVKTFYEYVEKYDLEEMIKEQKDIIISKLSQKISETTWNKSKNFLLLSNERINLIREFIVFQSYRNIERRREDLINFFRTVVKEEKNEKKTLDLKKELLKIFYLDRIDKFFLSCEKELNENLNSKLKLEIKDRSSINKREELKREYEREIRYMEDILPADLGEDFRYNDTMPDAIYKILSKEWEDEILKILHDVDDSQAKKLKKLKEISRKVKYEVEKLLEDDIGIEIDFKRVVEIIYCFSSVIDDILDYSLWYEEIKIKKEIMSNKLIHK